MKYFIPFMVYGDNLVSMLNLLHTSGMDFPLQMLLNLIWLQPSFAEKAGVLDWVLHVVNLLCF